MGTLAFEAAEALAARAFLNAGVPEDMALRAASALTVTEAMGLSTHGLARVPVYCERIAAGGIDARAVTGIEAVAPAIRRIDGADGLGPAVASIAVDACLDAAREVGVGAAFVRRGSHLGALAPYLLQAAERGFAMIASTNTAPMIAPPGGREARVGNTPIGIALPGAHGRHLLLDMALSTVSRSRIRRAAEAGEAIPADWATDADGHPTTDASEALRGLVRAIGGDKGASLALSLELFTALLAGAALAPDVPNAMERPDLPQSLGYTMIAIDASRLMAPGGVGQRLDVARAGLAAAPPIDPTDPVRLPGDRALARLADARAEGLTLPDRLLQALEDLAGD